MKPLALFFILLGYLICLLSFSGGELTCSSYTTEKQTIVQFCGSQNFTGSKIYLDTSKASTSPTNCTCKFRSNSETLITLSSKTGTVECDYKLKRIEYKTDGYDAETNTFCGPQSAQQIDIKGDQTLEITFYNAKMNSEPVCLHISTTTTAHTLQAMCLSDELATTDMTHSATTSKRHIITTEQNNREMYTPSTYKSTPYTTDTKHTETYTSSTYKSATYTPDIIHTETLHFATTGRHASGTYTNEYMGEFTKEYRTTDVTTENTVTAEATTDAKQEIYKNKGIPVKIIIPLVCVGLLLAIAVVIVVVCYIRRNKDNRIKLKDKNINRDSDDGDEMMYNALYHTFQNAAHDETGVGCAETNLMIEAVTIDVGEYAAVLPKQSAVSTKNSDENDYNRNGPNIDPGPMYAMPYKSKKQNEELGPKTSSVNTRKSDVKDYNCDDKDSGPIYAIPDKRRKQNEGLQCRPIES